MAIFFFPIAKRIEQSLEIWEIFIHGSEIYTGNNSANSAIIFDLKSPL